MIYLKTRRIYRRFFPAFSKAIYDNWILAVFVAFSFLLTLTAFHRPEGSLNAVPTGAMMTGDCYEDIPEMNISVAYHFIADADGNNFQCSDANAPLYAPGITFNFRPDPIGQAAGFVGFNPATIRR